jgi:hypothetical protein
VLHVAKSDLPNIADRCSVPASTSVTVAHHTAHDNGSPDDTSASKYATNDVSPNKYPDRNTTFCADPGSPTTANGPNTAADTTDDTTAEPRPAAPPNAVPDV